ncbi:AI-2E family transporter [Patescibacteria group bacterium]|nr:AI-2E family transporter [Patescibacteria group bacterium]
MDDKNYLGKAISALILVSLVIFSVFIIKPIALSIFMALVLVFIFAPIYNWLYKKTKRKTLSVIIVLALLIMIIALPIWFLTPILISEAIEIFRLTFQIDFVSTIQSISPKLFESSQFAEEVGSILSSFTSNLANNIVNSLAKIILNFPTILLNFLVILFTFFFVMREKENLLSYIRTILPFSKDVINKLFKHSSEITRSLLYGQVVVGILQGLILGIGLFIFGIPNALFLTAIAMIAGIIPIIGPFVIWVPLCIYLFVTQGFSLDFWGVLIFGNVASSIDNYLKPAIVSKSTKIHPAVIFISMIGGMFFFGILGILLGPLIISYLLIFLDIYRGKEGSPQLFK